MVNNQSALLSIQAEEEEPGVAEGHCTGPGSAQNWHNQSANFLINLATTAPRHRIPFNPGRRKPAVGQAQADQDTSRGRASNASIAGNLQVLRLRGLEGGALSIRKGLVVLIRGVQLRETPSRCTVNSR